MNLFPLIAALKKSYVDVFNPSGAAPKNDAPLLAPIMPTMPAQTNMNFFIPAAVPNTNQQNVSSIHIFIHLFIQNLDENNKFFHGTRKFEYLIFVFNNNKNLIEMSILFRDLFKLVTILQHRNLHRILL